MNIYKLDELIQDHLSYNDYGTLQHEQREELIKKAGYEIKQFQCPLTKYIIMFYINETNNIAYLHYKQIDFEHIKLLFLLIRTSVNKISKLNVKYIRHVVLKSDDLGNNNTWNTILNKEDLPVITIQCDITDVISNIDIAFG